MGQVIWNILLLSVAVFVAAHVVPGIRVKGFGTAVAVAVVYRVISFLLFWILVFLSFPFVLVTFGLFIFVINAFLLWLTSRVLDNFNVDGFGSALLGSLLISLCSVILRAIF